MDDAAKYVARLNKACERVNIFDDSLETKELYQTNVAKRMNNDLMKITQESDYTYPHAFLYRDFKLFAGEEIIKCEAVDIMIKLNLDCYTAWRRVITPVDITFKQLISIDHDTDDFPDYLLKMIDQVIGTT